VNSRKEDLMAHGSDLSMMYQGAFAPLERDSRRAGREISRMEAQTQTRLARIDNETDTTIAKGHSLSRVVAFAMGDVGQVAEVRKQVEMVAPEASGDLAMLAHVLGGGLAEIAADHRHHLRRM
jgi:hypothetical protein